MFKKYTISTISLTLFCITGLLSLCSFKKLPDNFLKGVAIAEYQNSGADNLPNSNWAAWEIRQNLKSGKALDHWQKFTKYAQLMKNELKLNAIRFSIDWSAVEPQEGKIDTNVLEYYNNVIDVYLKAGLEPMITLHHFVHPTWFEEKGAFTKEENIKYFVNFCDAVFQAIGKKVKLWCIINEPGIYATMGYFLGMFPPGERGNGYKTFLVQKNLLKAHCAAYKRIKSTQDGPSIQVGFVHQHLDWKPYSEYNPLEVKFCQMFSTLFHRALLEFLKTGSFEIELPFCDKITYAIDFKPFDFIGLNYYSRVVFAAPLCHIDCPLGGPTCFAGETMTDAPYAINPDGFYKAIKEVSEFNVPIYITEFGIADKNDVNRKNFITSYVDAMLKAISEGCPVRGCFYWTFADNFEWHDGYTQKFGLYAFNPESGEIKLRDGAKAYAEL